MRAARKDVVRDEQKDEDERHDSADHEILRVGVEHGAQRALVLHALVVARGDVRDGLGAEIGDFLVKHGQELHRHILADARGHLERECDRSVRHEVGEIPLIDVVLRSLLPQERDVGLAAFHGFQAVDDSRIDANLVVRVALAQHAVGRAVVNGCDDGMLACAFAARDGRIIADVERRREPEAAVFRPAEIPADVEEHLRAAALELFISRIEIRHGNNAHFDAEILLDAVDEDAQRPLECAVIIDVGKRMLTRDDDDGDDGMKFQITLFLRRQPQAEAAAVLGIDLLERRQEAGAVLRQAVGRDVELVQQSFIARPHSEVERVRMVVRRLRQRRRAFRRPLPADRQAREDEALHVRPARHDAEHDVDRARHETRAAAFPRIRHERDFHARIVRDGLHVVRLAAVEIARAILHALRRFFRHAGIAERMDADAQHGTGVGRRGGSHHLRHNGKCKQHRQ